MSQSLELAVLDDDTVAVELSQLAESINDEHRGVIDCAKRSLHHARAAGDKLRNAKKKLGKHGDWESWLSNSIDFSRRTAQAYMRIARRWGELEAKADSLNAQGVAFLGIQKAMQLLAKPKAELPSRKTTPGYASALDQDEDSDAFPRPHIEISEESPGVSRIEAVEENGTSYAAKVVAPGVSEVEMTGAELRAFHTAFVAAVNRIRILVQDVRRIPGKSELHGSFEVLMSDLESAFNSLKEAFDRE
jgi:hypothetical protein